METELIKATCAAPASVEDCDYEHLTLAILLMDRLRDREFKLVSAGGLCLDFILDGRAGRVNYVGYEPYELSVMDDEARESFHKDYPDPFGDDGIGEDGAVQMYLNVHHDKFMEAESAVDFAIAHFGG